MSCLYSQPHQQKQIMKKISLLICAVILATAFTTTFAEATPSALPTASASPAAQNYTCPMHPEVVQDKPGKCPKCGMNLVPKEEKKPETPK
jgi:hypothetical protein